MSLKDECWKMQPIPHLILWILPLTYTIFTSTHSTLCYSTSKIWLLSNIQQATIQLVFLVLGLLVFQDI